MSRDLIVTRNLAQSSKALDTEFRSKVSAIMNSPRGLDGPPIKISLVRADTSNTTPFGVYRTMRRNYYNLYTGSEPKDCILRYKDRDVKCSYRTRCALLALTLTGMNTDEDIATSVQEVGRVILSCESNGEISDEAWFDSLTDSRYYTRDEIVTALKDEAFDDAWKLEHMLPAKNREVFDGLHTPEEVEELVDNVYKKMKLDQKFVYDKKESKIQNVANYLAHNTV